MSEEQGLDCYEGFEVINAIETFNLGFHLGTALKCMLRATRKSENKIDDYKKAIWYVERFINIGDESHIYDECDGVMEILEKICVKFDLDTWSCSAVKNLLGIREQNLQAVLGVLNVLKKGEEKK